MSTQTTQGQAVKIFVALFFIFVMSFLLWALAWSLKDLAMASASVKWSSTDGVIISSRIQAKCKNLASFMPEILYRYAVEQQEYVGHRINFGDNLCRSKIDAERIANTYPEGKKIRIHFDPTSPENAAINVSSTEHGTRSVFIITLIFIGVVSLIAYYSIKRCLSIK